eukprot:5809-Heterococcus_DN1.PRE.3
MILIVTEHYCPSVYKYMRSSIHKHIQRCNCQQLVPEASIECAAVRAYAATAVDRSVHRVVLVKIALFKYVLEVQTLFPGSLQHPCPHPT